MPTATDRRVLVTLKPVTCYLCGCLFGMVADYQDDRRRKGDTWYCPNGHPQVYAETTETRLRRELEGKERALARAWESAAWWREEEARVRKASSILKGQLTKARRRAAHGVCPVPECRRQFDNLARHMAAKHAGYRADADQAARNGTEPKNAGQIAETIDGPYGSMRKTVKQGGPGFRPAVYYDCACGWSGGAARGAAARHARTCARAREPWPTAT